MWPRDTIFPLNHWKRLRLLRNKGGSGITQEKVPKCSRSCRERKHNGGTFLAPFVEKMGADLFSPFRLWTAGPAPFDARVSTFLCNWIQTGTRSPNRNTNWLNAENGNRSLSPPSPDHERPGPRRSTRKNGPGVDRIADYGLRPHLNSHHYWSPSPSASSTTTIT